MAIYTQNQLLKSEVFLTNKAQIVCGRRDRKYSIGVTERCLGRRTPTPSRTPLPSHVLDIEFICPIQLGAESLIRLSGLASMGVVLVLLAFSMVILSLEVHHPPDRLVNESQEIVSILIVSRIEVLIEQTVFSNDVVTDQEQIPASDSMISLVTVDRSERRILQGLIVHLLEQSRTECHVIIHDDPVRTLHVCLDHQVP